MKFSVRALSPLWRVIFCVCFASASFAQTQSSARLAGTVTDPGGAAIAGAEVVAQPVGGVAAPPTSLQRAVSTAEGFYVLTVEPGRYRITVTHASFSIIQQEIMLGAGETRELPIRMPLEPLSSSVVVTAQAIPVPAESTSAAVTIVAGEEIRRRGATSLPDLLATQPGFSLGRTGPLGGAASLFLDGGNSSYTKVLVDGAAVNEPGNAVDFSNFTLDNVEKIEIVHGAESVLYGSDAVAGVVQIFTRRGTTRTPELSAFAEGGSFDTARGGAALSGVAGRLDYSGAGSYLETGGQGPNNGFLNRTVSGNFGWRVSESAKIHLALRNNTSDARIPGQTGFVPPNLDQHNGLHNFNASLRAEFSNGRWHHELLGTESYNRENFANLLADYYVSPDPLGFCFYPLSPQAVVSDYCDATFAYKNQYNRTAFRGQSSYVTAKASLTAGYQYEVENAWISLLGGSHARRNNQAGFLDGQWQALPRLTLTAGARAESNASFGTRVVPRVGAAYALRVAQGALGDTLLRVSYGQGIKEPRMDQSFGSDPCFPGNLDLRPEQSRTFHAVAEQRLASDRVRLTADYFENHFQDIVSFQFCLPGGPCPVAAPPGCPFGFGTYFNTDLARARGANLSGEARLTRWLSMTAGYSHNATRVLSAPNAFDPALVVGNRLIRRPLHSGNVVLNAAFGAMNWNLAGYFTGERTDSDFLGLGIERNARYARLDLAGSYNFPRGVSLYGRIANMTDRRYQEAVGFPALGREVRVGLRYRTRHE